MNHEGYKDPTPETAFWELKREEKVKGLERRYQIRRGDKIQIKEKNTDREERARDRYVIKNMEVVGLYTNHVLLKDKMGIQECFTWHEFFKKKIN